MALALAGMSAVTLSCSSNDDITDVQIQSHEKKSELEKEVSKTKTYKIRFGLLSQNGTKILSGNHDVGSFLAENIDTGEVYDTYYSGGFQTLPQYYEGIPAGNYIFSAMQGQGGWTGYGSVTMIVSDDQVDNDGYITVYIPVTWSE